jgi:excisionase family DNA binding protein
MGNAVEMLRAGDVAPLLGVSRRRVYQLVRSGAIPAVRHGRTIRIPRAAWDWWLERQVERALSETADSEGRDPAA